MPNDLKVYSEAEVSEIQKLNAEVDRLKNALAEQVKTAEHFRTQAVAANAHITELKDVLQKVSERTEVSTHKPISTQIQTVLAVPDNKDALDRYVRRKQLDYMRKTAKEMMKALHIDSVTEAGQILRGEKE